jgi:hypothetical protein
MKRTRAYQLGVTVFILGVLPVIAFARAGGGGSGGGGGGGGGHSSGGYSGGGRGGGSSCVGSQCVWPVLFIAGVFIFIIAVNIITAKQKKKKQLEEDAAMKATVDDVAAKDPSWNSEHLETLAKDIFFEFQRAWGEYDVPALEKILEPSMHKRIALELSVLNNEGRRNPTTIKELVRAAIVNFNDEADNSHDTFSVEFTASAKDELLETVTGKTLFEDNSTFTETWDFIRSGDTWKLYAIHQATENPWSLDGYIAQFAEKHGFYYNPDFGWLMLPNKGQLFADSRFGRTDINNHVVGYYRDKIVEFYTMDIMDGNGKVSKSYFIAQAILPMQHNDILVRRKHMLQFGPWGMVKHEMESNAFIKEFEVYSDEKDTMETFELLTPDFMEQIMKLPFELTIEVVGNTLYLATEAQSGAVGGPLSVIAAAMTEGKDTGTSMHETMLGVLDKAFDAMKM